MKHAQPTAPSVRPSACPGLLRIVQAKDGGICRIKLPCGRLDSHQARAIAAAASQHASGVIEATNRSNLQIRGVKADAEQALIDALLAARLGADSPGADDVRNLMVSPLAGLDPSALVDISPLAARILALLQDKAHFHALSPKFALLLDGGESMAMLEHPHDLWVSAMGTGDHAQFAFGLAGCPPQSTGDVPALAAVPRAQVPALVEALLDLFLELATPEQTRMRHLLAEHPEGDLLLRLQQRLDVPLLPVGDWHRPAPQPFAHLGIHDGRHVGGAPALGRLDATQLKALADLADSLGDGNLRLTPWQSVLLPNARDPEAVQQAMHDLGLATNANAPLARLVACTGSAGCARGLADTKSDALALAALLPPGAVVHLSGCPRSCASAHVAPFTLLATGPGQYDLYQRGGVGFGRLLARDISLKEAGERLASPPDTWSSTQ
ncbi:precorrin-3B synthase [Pseudomonas sp. JS3066]|uniref:precorrin-3B synthase n=1 Tax=unclassified Pseudomonas TaxID=196821 RepID=UPI0012C49AB7|nr:MULTISPECIES: precorrin-3B synthase [unclassified Pseudomonas]MDH4651573.1 precorrin-3B synthase [Pseudomonas sp. BN606]MRK20627.1 precorrin-3B synthase [Pseudomonas sp. JG-B]WVK93754.1 precorrin-3B synthase [Pseudomonas sp. JS3066]